MHGETGSSPVIDRLVGPWLHFTHAGGCKGIRLCTRWKLQQQRVSAGPWRGRTGLGMGEDFGSIWSHKQRYNTAPRAPPSSFGMDRRLGTDPDEAEGGPPSASA